MRFVSTDALAQLLTMSEVIGVMRDAFVEHSEGRAVIPERLAMTLPGTRDTVLVMPGALHGRRAMGIKVVSVFPGNPIRHGKPVITAQVLYIDPDSGEVAMMLDGTWVTAMRTGAVSGLATDLLARRNAEHLVLYGAGAQAATQIDAVCAVRDIRRITVCTRSANKASAFIDAARTRHPDVVVECGLSPDDAAATADIVVTATSSRVPVFDGRRLRPGTHVNAIGSFTPDARELDTVTVTRGRVYVDDLEHAWREAGDLRIPHDEGAFVHTQIVGDLGDLVSGRCQGRVDDEAITVFKSVGLAIEDVAVAARVWELSRAAASAGPS